MSVLVRAVKAAWNEINTPETFRKGEVFQSYVRQHLFCKDEYIKLQKTPGYVENKGDFAENTKEPDFKFMSANGKTFFVEAKYRSRYFKGSIELCKPYQMRRFREIAKRTPIYVVIGVGGHSTNPAEVFFLPFKKIQYSCLFPSFLRPYQVPANRPISENQLV